MLKSFSFSQHCSSSGCGAVSPSLPFPCSFPLSSASSFVLVFTAASICCQKATWPWSFCTHSPDPATWNLPLSHPDWLPRAALGVSDVTAPSCSSQPCWGQSGHKHGPRETPGQPQLLLLLFPISSDISKVSVMFSSRDLWKSPPCCLNKSLGWLCRVSSPRTAVLAVFAE